MKFTKEEACKDLMSQIPTKGETLQLSERSINEQLETLMPLLANDETELADFIASVLPVFRTADANVRANVSAQVKDYKEKNPVTPIVKKEDEKPAEDDAMAKALARIEELERKNAENERRAQLSTRRSEVVSKMKEKGVKDKDWINAFLDEVSLDGENFDVDAKVESYVKMYNKSLAIVDPDVTPQGAGGGRGEDKALTDVIKGASAFVKSQRLD
jgi:hypothetical protein